MWNSVTSQTLHFNEFWVFGWLLGTVWLSACQVSFILVSLYTVVFSIIGTPFFSPSASIGNWAEVLKAGS